MGPNWPRRRYEIIVKKGGAPLGLKLHQTKSRRGVYANGFAEGSYPPPGPQACMRVGDVLISVDGKNVQDATLTVALATIETARRRDRLRDFISAKQDDPHRGNVVMVFERVSPRLTFRDVALDPRKVVYLLNYMLEVRCAGTSLNGGAGSSATNSEGGEGGGGGKKEPVIISLDEARLMFWLEVQVLFEMSAVMAPSRADMSKVYDKFFRPGSGFYVHELAEKRQPKLGTRRSWNGDVSGMHSVGRDLGSLAAKDAQDGAGAAEPQTRSSSPTTVDAGGSRETSKTTGSGRGEDKSSPAGAGGANGRDPIVKDGGDGGAGTAAESSGSGGGTRESYIGGSKRGKGGGSSKREAGGKTDQDDEGLDAGDWSSLPMEFLAADLSKIFRASQEKVEETLTAGCFYLFKTSPWKGRMVAHLNNSPDFVHVPFAKIMAEQELRDVMLLHMMVGQTPGWLQVWREIETSVKPRLTLLQTRRSVRQQRGSPPSPHGVQGVRRGEHFARYMSTAGLATQDHLGTLLVVANTHGRINHAVQKDSNTVPPDPKSSVDAKTEAAIAILTSAVYLWDFFLSADSHASLGLARDTSAYRTLKELLEDSVPGVEVGGKGRMPQEGPRLGRDARVDHAVSVGKALLDMQRHVLRKLCASVYPDFQASVCYEHLCSELTMGPRSPARLPPAVATALRRRRRWSPRLQSREKPRSPFAFLGGGSPPRDSPRERDRERVAWDGTRRSSAPGVHAGGVAGRGAGAGGTSAGRGGLGSGRAGATVGGDSSAPDGDVPRPSVQGGGKGIGAVSGPQFDLLWRASRGWLLEKVMRRVELPTHVSRHRPPRACLRPCGRSRRGLVRTAISPQLHEHLSLPHNTRRLGRRPYSIAGSPNSARPGFGAGENRGSELLFGGATQSGGGGEGGTTEEEVRGCAEWAVSFSGSLDQGITTVKTEHAVCVAPRSLGLDVPPEGLEPFFCPCLPASGRGSCACAFLGGQELHLQGKFGTESVDVGSESGQGCSGAGFSPPPPRLFTFAAPGRSGAGIFYGACLSVFRPVSQWVGDAPTPAAPGLEGRRSISPTPSSVASAPDAPTSEALSPPPPPSAAAATVLDAPNSSHATPEEGSGAPNGIIAGAEGTGTEAPVAEAPASVTDGARGGSPLPTTEGVEGEGVSANTAAAAEHETTGNGTAGEIVTGRTVVAEEGATKEGEHGGVEDGKSGEVADGVGASIRKGVREGVVIVEEATLEGLGEGEETAEHNSSSNGAVPAAAKEPEDSRSLEKTPSMLEMLKLKRGLGIFGRSSSGNQTKVSPSPLSLSTAVALAIPSPGSRPSGDKPTPEADTTEPTEADGHAAAGAPTPVDVTGSAQEAGNHLTLTLTPGGSSNGRPAADATTATSTTPSVLDIPTRFKMSIGMFGSGKSSPGRLNRGPKSGSSTPAASSTFTSTFTTATSTTSAEAGGTSSTPRSSAGGAGKFSSYARRAGNFLGSDSRGMGRATRLTPPLSPDVLPNGPPPPSPLVSSVFMASPTEGLLETEVSAAVVGAGGSAARDGDSAKSRGEHSASASGGHKRSLSGATMAAAAEDGSNSATGEEILKARSMSAAAPDSRGVDTSASGSGSPEVGEGGELGGAVGEGDAGRGAGGRGSRQKHDFFVSSGVCLLSTRPEIGAMRRALAAYWAANRDEILSGAGAVKRDCSQDGEDKAASAARRSVGGDGDGGESGGATNGRSQDLRGEEE
ncbi:unnamed protein product, partial [Scytosiphon promiscuus]